MPPRLVYPPEAARRGESAGVISDSRSLSAILRAEGWTGLRPWLSRGGYTEGQAP